MAGVAAGIPWSMAILRRAPRLPKDVAAHVPRGTRVLHVAPLADDQWAAVARHALLVLGPDGLVQTTAWDEVETGTWDGDARTFTIIWSDRERDEQVLQLLDDEVADFTGALRERIQSSVIHAEMVEVEGTRVRATVRRREDGSLYSRLTAFGPLTGTAEETAQLDALERRVREGAGLDP